MGKKSRAERRHHHHRMIDKVKNFWWLQADKYWGSEERRQKHIRKMAETRHPCSCHMCGNPRRMFKEETFQEKKLNQDWERLKNDWNTVWNDNERG